MRFCNTAGYLAASDLAPKTIQQHVDNLWVLGGEIIRDLNETPSSAAACNGLGLIAIQRQDPGTARGYFEKAVALDADLVEAQLNLGLIYKMAGDRAHARQCFETFLAKASPTQYREIIPKVRETLLVVLTVFDDDQRIFEAVCAGASGYLLKKTPAPRLIEGIREAAAGGAPMSPEIASRVMALFRQVRPAPAPGHDLTPHEQRLLQLLVDGHNYKTAAVELGVSVNTISFHLRRIYDKLHVHSKSEAVSKALRNQIVG